MPEHLFRCYTKSDGKCIAYQPNTRDLPQNFDTNLDAKICTYPLPCICLVRRNGTGWLYPFQMGFYLLNYVAVLSPETLYELQEEGRSRTMARTFRWARLALRRRSWLLVSTPRAPDIAVPCSSWGTGIAASSVRGPRRGSGSTIVLSCILILIPSRTPSSFALSTALTFAFTFLVRVVVELATATFITAALLKPKITVSFASSSSVPGDDLRRLSKRSSAMSIVKVTLPLAIMGTLFKMTFN